MIHRSNSGNLLVGMKKKIILCLISIFSVFIMIFSLTGCSYNTGNQDATVANFVQGTTPYETLQSFLTGHPQSLIALINARMLQIGFLSSLKALVVILAELILSITKIVTLKK